MPMGGTELLIILTIILLFFGAKRVLELGRSLGRSMREFYVGASGEDEKDEVKQLPDDAGGEPPRADQRRPRTRRLPVRRRREHSTPLEPFRIDHRRCSG